jgi:hypothetical protein
MEGVYLPSSWGSEASGGGVVDQFLAAIRKILIQGIDWLFWLISTAWSWTFGQISRALSLKFQSLPDWKAILYIILIILLLYMARLIIPRILGATIAILMAIWGLLETLMKIVTDLAWYIAIAYGVALAINTIKWGSIIGKMPWQ